MLGNLRTLSVGLNYGFKRAVGQCKLRKALAGPLLSSLSACSYYFGLQSPLIKIAFQQFLYEIGLACSCLVLCLSKLALRITFFHLSAHEVG